MTNPVLNLTVQYAAASGDTPTRQQFRKWVRAALAREAQITLRLVDEAEGRALNLDYRGKDYATNVLTFPLQDQPLLGDIALCVPVIAREAAEQGKLPEAHYAHMTVHGVLHLLGYDHATDAEAAVMETLETQIVTKFGYADPYRIAEEAIAHGR